jgi:uncharacterized membrane protein YdbT with pleckstrin-like domain
MGRYVDSVLLPGERVDYAASIHWIIFVRGLGIALLGAILSAKGQYVYWSLFGAHLDRSTYQTVQWISMGLVLYGCLMLALAWIYQATTELVITDRRVLAKFGFISRNTHELFLSKVEGANIDQTIPGRLLGYGSVIVRGTGGGFSPIDQIAGPKEFQKFLMFQIERDRNGHDRSRSARMGQND